MIIRNVRREIKIINMVSVELMRVKFKKTDDRELRKYA